jgi:hypothetical protein
VSTKIVNAVKPGLFGSSWGIFSECDRYRYLLAVPTGETNERIAAFVLANPSTATPDKLDPTLTRCREYARRWGFGWLWVVNVRAWRETDPEKVPADPQAIGPENSTSIVRACLSSELVVCGWGNLAGTLGPQTLQLIRISETVPHALKLNKDGSPAHPLYLRSDAVPFAMSGEGPFA